MSRHIRFVTATATATAAGALCAMLGAGAAWAAFIGVPGANSIDGSLCVGNDCVSSEAFGFDTIRLKENNLRLHFDDTSTSASFPPNDWRIYANDSNNGGSSYFGVEDATAGRFVFRIFAGARSNALTVDSQGDVGLGTTTPAVELDIKTGDTPTVRLQQDGTSGFTPQTWDVAGNEAGFFIRDATGGSQLPFRIRPGAPSSSIDISADGEVAIGHASPEAPLHIEGNIDNNLPHMIIEATAADGRAELWFIDGETDNDNDALRMQLREDTFNIVYNGSGGGLRIHQNSNVEVPNGDLIVDGTISSGGTNLNVPDYVFAPDYELMPLTDVAAFIAENSHLPHIPSAAEVNANGLNLTHMQLAILKTVEELTLYTLEQHATNAAQAEMIEALQAEIRALKAQ